MKLSKNTIDVLQNFATINQSILFLEGNNQKTLTPLKTSYAEATIAEEFPREFAVYDLNMLLGLLSLFKEPDIEFTDTSLVMTEGKQRATYRYCQPALITSPPKDKKVSVGPIAHTFELPGETLRSLMKAVALYGHEYIAIEADGEQMYVRTLNVKEKGESDGASYQLGESDKTFKYVLSTENLKLMPLSYDVQIGENMAVCFKAKELDVTYIVPCEASHSTKG